MVGRLDPNFSDKFCIGEKIVSIRKNNFASEKLGLFLVLDDLARITRTYRAGIDEYNIFKENK